MTLLSWTHVRKAECGPRSRTQETEINSLAEFYWVGAHRLTNTITAGQKRTRMKTRTKGQQTNKQAHSIKHEGDSDISQVISEQRTELNSI